MRTLKVGDIVVINPEHIVGTATFTHAYDNKHIFKVLRVEDDRGPLTFIDVQRIHFTPTEGNSGYLGGCFMKRFMLATNTIYRRTTHA